MSFDVKIDQSRLDVRLDRIEPATLIFLRLTVEELDAQLVDAAQALAPVKTGRYRASIKGSISSSKKAIVGRVYSHSPLANIIETGADIPPHEILPNVAQALHFGGTAGDIFAARVHSPGAHLEGKDVIGGAFDSMRDDIRAEIETAGHSAARSV